MWRQEPLNYHTSSFAAVSAGPMCKKFLCVSGSSSWTSGCMARGASDYAERHAGMPRAVQAKLEASGRCGAAKMELDATS